MVMAMLILQVSPRPGLVRNTLQQKEIKSAPEWGRNLRNPMLAMMYSTSVATCMASAMSTEDGLGLGTLGLNPVKLEEMVTVAGFTRFVMHDFEDPTNLYYEIRP